MRPHMKTTCPCCNQPVDTKRDLPLVDLNTNSLAYGDVRIHLTPQQTEFMAALVETAPGACSYDRLISRLWGVNEPDAPMITLKAVKWRLCRILCNIGFDIVTLPGVGMRLTKATPPTPAQLATQIRAAVA